ncbi:MAG TPA: carboxyl transferase domain-containing protein [Candidatus Dormibacteraeota bacterium]|nr:carboxyl transferase domain-containing protein [Candidatus Dormibacteraeota bacterium]
MLLPFSRIAILDRGTAALRAIHAVHEYAWEAKADLEAVALYDEADRGALWVREADDAIPVGARLADAVSAARADALWASWRPIAPLEVIAALIGEAAIANISASSSAVARLADADALAPLAAAVDLPLAADAAAGPRLRLDVLADAAGTVWVFGPRQTILQRDGRPLIEELEPGAPPQRLREIANRLVRALALRGAATIELGRDAAGDGFALAGVVPHLEPGHALAEAATGLDLMKLQLHLAAGGTLADVPPMQAAFALGAQLAVEPAGADRVKLLRRPAGVGLRVDAGVGEGDAVSGDIARLVVRGRDRAEALGRLRRALVDTAVVLRRGLANKQSLLDALGPDPSGGGTHADAALLRAALAAYDDEAAVAQAQFYAAAARGRPRLPAEVGRIVDLSHGGQSYRLTVRRTGAERYRVEVDGAALRVTLQRHGEHEARLRLGRRGHRVLAVPHGDGYLVEVDGSLSAFSRSGGAVVRAPAPAVVLSVAVAPGRVVRAGEPLLVLEAMKTEMPVLAPFDGRIAEVLVLANVQVDTGAPLLRFEPPAAAAGAAAARIVCVAPAADGETPAERAARNLAELRPLLLGYDADPGDLGELLAERAAACAALAPDDAHLRAGEQALLATFADVQALFRRRGGGEAEDEDEEGGDPLGTEEYLVAYLRTPGRSGESLPPRFLDKLRQAVAHHGVRSLDPSPELEAALFRLAQVSQRPAQSSAVVRAVLERWLAQRAQLAPAVGAEQRALLDRLVAVAQGRDQALAELAREVHYRFFDEPLFAAARSRAYAEVEAHLDALAGGAADAAAHVAALVDSAQPLIGHLAHRFAAASVTLRQALLEVLVRRYYRVRPLEGLRAILLEGRAPARPGAGNAAGRGAAEAAPSNAAGSADRPIGAITASYQRAERRVRVLATYAGEADLRATLTALRSAIAAVPAGEDAALELYVEVADALGESDAAAAALAAVLSDGALPPGLRRVAVVRFACGAGDGPARVQHFTFRPRGGRGGSPAPLEASSIQLGYAEEPLTRGVHPLIGKRLQLWRLANFRCERLPSPADIYLFRAVAHANAKDERFFALAEVRDLTPVRDAAGRITELPHLERMLTEALAALRQAQAQRPARERLYWNRILLYVWPPLDLRADELTEVVHRLAPATAGLGLEQVALRARMPDPETGALRDGVLRISNPGGRGLVITSGPPPEQPLQPMSEYEQRVVRMRQRGLVYPYELIRMLTPAGGDGDFPGGTFVEYDLDEEQRLVPMPRPYGQNTANQVVGVIRTATARYPEGMTRVLICGDPSRSMGSVAEPECRRINAALDLAESLGVPVDWFDLCSGAKIAMDSGTENLDWCARSIRRIVEFTQAGGEINVVVYGINVGAQSYWNAEATMLMHTRGILVMTGDGAMVLTGKRALDYSGGVSADDDLGIGGYERIMGPNGQAQYWAADLTDACKLLLRHYEHAYVAPGERLPRRAETSDPSDRDISGAPHGRLDGIDFATIGDVLSPIHNPGRKKPFDIRRFMSATIDRDHPPLERWPDMRNAESAVVWDAHLGGWPVCLIGIECRPLQRFGFAPADGPGQWTAGTLFPRSSKKVARAINAASGNRPVVVLANLSGFDGSPESMRALQLEYGAEIGRAVVNFRGPFVFCVISRYHGGAYVVFSKMLNERLEAAALEGSYASVIGGAPAAAVVFAGEVEQQARRDPRLRACDERIAAAAEPERARLREEREERYRQIHAEKLGEIAEHFDQVHSVYRAQQTGSLDHILPPARLRPYLIEALERGIAHEERT